MESTGSSWQPAFPIRKPTSPVNWAETGTDKIANAAPQKRLALPRVGATSPRLGCFGVAPPWPIAGLH